MTLKKRKLLESKVHTLNTWCMSLLSLSLISTPVLADNPVTLPNNAVCSVTISSPLTGDPPFTLPSGDSTMDIDVSGSAGVTEGDPLMASFVYVLDISGSTASGGGTGCAPILDCEQQFLKTLNQEIIDNGVSDEVGMVVYAASAAIADMTPTTGVQTVIAPNAGNGTYPSYVNTVIDSTISYPTSTGSEINQFTYYTVGRTTNCKEGLVKAKAIAQTTTHTPKIVIFTSDGVCNRGTQAEFDAAVQDLVDENVIIHSIAVGTNSSCLYNEGSGSLNQMAQETSGQCFEVADPGYLPDIIPTFIGSSLDSLELQVDGGTSILIPNSGISSNLPDSGPITVDYTTLAQSLGVGSHEICVTANCSEPQGTGSATQCETIQIDPTPPVDLTVALAGNGSGNVGSSPAGITCGVDCNEPYNVGTTVTLTATPDANSNFTGWSGACSGTDPSVTVTMDAAKSCTATFTLNQFDLSVALAGNGSGNVGSSPAGITCGADCNEPYNVGTTVTLIATPDANSNFTGWSGACSGTDPSVTVTMDAAKSCTATFTLKQFDLSVALAGNGSGNVGSSPAGITCGVDCNEPYNVGTTVTLTATPDASSIFTGWSGDCSGTDSTVTVIMDTDKTCTATFIQISAGRMTGGGTLEKGKGKGKVGVSHGFELHCNPNESPNNLEVNWNNSSDRFHLDTLTSAICVDDPNINQKPPAADFDTYIGQGVGSYNGVPGATISWLFTDAGEPGTKDYAEMTITDVGGNVVLTVAGSLNQGNQQAHK
jgi:hypothetical protein